MRGVVLWLGALAAMALIVLAWDGGARSQRLPSPRSFAWPIRPFDRPHPIRGTFGEPRGLLDLDLGVQGNARARLLKEFDPIEVVGQRVLHTGIDIVATDGTPVYAVTSGVARTGGRGYDQHVVVGAFGYWHLAGPVPSGTHVTAFRTVIGRVYPGQGHVHLTRFDARGQPVNPLVDGGITPYADTSPPEIGRIGVIDPEGGPVPRNRVAGPVALVAKVADRQSTGGLLTGVYGLRYSLVPRGRRGTPVGPITTIQLERLPSARLADTLYTVASTRHGTHPRFWYRLTARSPSDDGLIHTEGLAPGRYWLVVTAWDARGNAAVRAVAIRVVPAPRPLALPAGSALDPV